MIFRTHAQTENSVDKVNKILNFLDEEDEIQLSPSIQRKMSEKFNATHKSQTAFPKVHSSNQLI